MFSNDEEKVKNYLIKIAVDGYYTYRILERGLLEGFIYWDGIKQLNPKEAFDIVYQEYENSEKNFKPRISVNFFSLKACIYFSNHLIKQNYLKTLPFVLNM